MLWDVIRDFFVMYIFGGFNSDLEAYSGFIGLTAGNNDLYTDSYYFKTGESIGNINYNLTIGDWLSTTFTIITLILICYMFLRLTIWLFKFGAGLFKW